MQIKTFIACACGAFVLSLGAAPAPEERPVLTVKDNGYAVLTEAVLQKAIARDFEIRKKLSDPRYYKDVQGDFKDLLRELYRDPFDGRLVATDKSLPEQDQKELWDIWKAYEAYMRRCEMRQVMGSLLSFYDGNSMFRYAARVERARDFYKSDRMKKLLHDMKLFNADFKRLDTSVKKSYEEGYSFGLMYQRRVTLSRLFNAETFLGSYVNEYGTPKTAFWNSLSVLMRYNERMCDDELKKMKAAAEELDKKICLALDARLKAVKSASFYENGWTALAGIDELDQRIIDCVTAAMHDLNAAIKKFEDTGSPEFALRSGLELPWVFMATGADTNQKLGPDYHALVLKGYFYLKDQYDKLSMKRHGVPIPLDEKSVKR